MSKEIIKKPKGHFEGNLCKKIMSDGMIFEGNIDEAMYDYKIALAWTQSEGGNPVVSMMEQGYTEKEAIFIHDLYLSRLTK
jgi:hypothetical protein